MRFTYALFKQHLFTIARLKGMNMMKKLVIIVLAIFIVGYVALMVQYF
jgi:hypothetical protein